MKWKKWWWTWRAWLAARRLRRAIKEARANGMKLEPYSIKEEEKESEQRRRG